MLEQKIYYLPGHGGRLNSGLGQGILDLGVDVVGHETRGSFKQLTFQEQIDLVAEDLKNQFWDESSRVIANSFGAYLFLHAQAQLPPFIGKVLCCLLLLVAFRMMILGLDTYHLELTN